MSLGGKPMVARCDAPDACPVAEDCALEGQVLCTNVWLAHADKLQLCDAIESVADALPHSVDRLKCLQIANELVPLLRNYHSYEEDQVFPVFEDAEIGDLNARAGSIRRLKGEHLEDECAAQDVTDALLEIGHGCAVDNPEALGFMLRAFFETMRRHIAFEREHILPVVAALKATKPRTAPSAAPGFPR